MVGFRAGRGVSNEQEAADISRSVQAGSGWTGRQRRLVDRQSRQGTRAYRAWFATLDTGFGRQGVKQRSILTSCGACFLHVFEPPATVSGLDDVEAVGDAVEKGYGHFDITEDAYSSSKTEVGGDEKGIFIVALADVATKHLLCAVMKQPCAAGIWKKEVAEFIDDDGVDQDELFGQIFGSSLSLFALRHVDRINRVVKA